MELTFCKILHATHTLTKFIYKSHTKTKFPHSLIEEIFQRIIYGRFSSSGFCTPQTIKKAFTYAHTLQTLDKGDYYEFGVYKGFSIWYSQQTAYTYNASRMNFFGFDSFSGIPSTEGIDNDGEFYKGQYASSTEEVKKNIISHGGNMKTIHFIEGYYKDSLKNNIKTKLNMKKISIALIDCDLYSSTTEVLEFIQSLLMINSIILFDDWNAFSSDKNMGEQQAFSEFQNKYPSIQFKQIYSFCWHGRAFQVVDL